MTPRLILLISSGSKKKKKKKKKGSPLKDPSLKVPFMEFLKERCPTTPSFTCQSPQYMSPLPQTRFPSGGKGPP